MDGKKITDTTSDAYAQIKKLYVEDGHYTDGEYLAVAMSSFYGSVGDRFKVTLSSGEVLKLIMADTKKDEHVNDDYSHITDGSVIEFVVDIETLNPQAVKEGSLDCLYRGSITKIEIMEEKQ